MGMNMEDEELVTMVNPTLKRKETILFFLIVVINGLKCIVLNIGLDTCARGRWRVEVSKLEINFPSTQICVLLLTTLNQYQLDNHHGPLLSKKKK